MKYYHTIVTANNVPIIFELNEEYVIRHKILERPLIYPRTAHKSKKVNKIYYPTTLTNLIYADARNCIAEWLLKHTEEGDCISGVISVDSWRETHIRRDYVGNLMLLEDYSKCRWWEDLCK